MPSVSAVMSVFKTLKNEIRQQHAVGDLLPNERTYSEKLNVSRNTVREAMIYLEAYGFLEKTQRGPRVTTPDIGIAFDIIEDAFDRSLETCHDVLEFRRGIDLAIMASVVRNITPAQIEELRRHLDAMRGALTVRDAAEADCRFHQVLIDASGNEVIRRLFLALRRIIVFYQEIGKQVPHHDVPSQATHRAIITALEERSLPKLLVACEAHYDQSRRSLEEAIAAQRSASPTPVASGAVA